MISQIVAELLHNRNSIPNNFKSFIKQVYEKEGTQNILKKKHPNNYSRPEISQKEQQLPRRKVKKKIDFS